MSTPVKVKGTSRYGEILEVEMAQRNGHPSGAVVYATTLEDFDLQFAPFINSEYGTAMNQDASFGGTPDIIHVGTGDGVYWTGSNIVGGKVNFNNGDRASSGSVSVKVDNPALNDLWQFDKGSYLTVTNYTGITFQINIDKDWDATDSISLYGWDVSGSNMVGAEVFVENYINELDFDVWQSVSIPFSDMGIVSTDFDAIRMGHPVKGGGKSPKFYIDDMQAEQTGTPIIFKTSTQTGVNYHIDSLVITLVDNVTGGLSYNKLMGLTALTNGAVLQHVRKGESLFSLPIRQLSSLLSVGFTITNQQDDGVDTIITLKQDFVKPLVIKGGTTDYLSITITDDLSSLLQFNCAARGAIEIQ